MQIIGIAVKILNLRHLRFHHRSQINVPLQENKSGLFFVRIQQDTRETGTKSNRYFRKVGRSQIS